MEVFFVKVLKWLDNNMEECIMVTLLITMTFIMGIQVCARYLFDYSLTWSEEITRYLFIWSTFISISYCTRKSIAIKIEQVINLLLKRKKAFVKLLNHTIELLFFLYLIPFAYLYFRASIESGQVSPACEIPMYIVQIAPLIGFILVAIRTVQQWILEFNIMRGR